MSESQEITRKSASNLALAFILLPREKRVAMSTLYAFCREVDDVADEETVPLERRREQMQEWREDIRLACEGGEPKFPVNREMKPIAAQYGLKQELFEELILGCEMDLDIKRHETFADLELYCHRVASVVGLLSIEIFGYQNPACKDYAEYLGKALQLTNILRDVRTDAELGRIYLPLEELERFNVRSEELLNFEYSDRYRQLAESIAARAKDFYRKAAATLPREDRDSMVSAELMGSVYWRLLLKLEKRKFNVFGPRLTRLNKLQKIALILRTKIRMTVGVMTPNYGVS
jgi:phytoene synthase